VTDCLLLAGFQTGLLYATMIPLGWRGAGQREPEADAQPREPTASPFRDR